MGQKTQQKHNLFPPAETEKKKKFLTILRGKSDDIAHGSIIQVSMVDIRPADSTRGDRGCLSLVGRDLCYAAR